MIEGMVSFEFLFQLIQARPTHNALQAIAKETETSPNGPETINIAGMKRTATLSKPAVSV